MILALAILAAAAAPTGTAQTAAPEPARMGQAVLRATVPVYPGATEAPIAVGETLQANGVPMNVQSFMTDDPPRKVLDFYKAEFGKWHLPMLGNGQIEGGRFPYPSITVFDELNEVEISVVTIPSPEGHTMVLLARADMRPIREDLQRAQAGRYGGLPVYPNGESPAAVMFTDGEVKRVQVTFDTVDAPAKVLAFYEAAFTRAGAKPQAAPDGVLAFHLAGGSWRISTAVDAPTHHTVVSALRTDETGAPTAQAEVP